MTLATRYLLVAALALLTAVPSLAQETEPTAVEIDVPDVTLVDQDGNEVRLLTDVIQDRVVALNFIFTRCPSICSPMSAIFRRVQEAVAHHEDVILVSISLDPVADSPERLREYAERFDRQDGWVFLGGRPDQVRQAIRAFGGHMGRKEDHPPLFLIGDARSGQWRRIFGLVDASVISDQVEAVVAERVAAAPAPEEEATGDGELQLDEQQKAARSYFTDTELVDQTGRTHRFYTDLVHDRTVLINFGFTSCKTGCLAVVRNLRRVQEELGEQMGREVHLITISVDPENDTIEALERYVADFEVGPGWYFLTGSPENVNEVLRRLGGWVPHPDQHSMTLLVGDARTGTWSRGSSLDRPEAIVAGVSRLIP